MQRRKTEILLGERDDIVHLEERRDSDPVTCTFREENTVYPVTQTRRNWHKMFEMQNAGHVDLDEMLSRVYIPFFDHPKSEYWLDRYIRLEYDVFCMNTRGPANENVTPMSWFTQMIVRTDSE